jgi:cytochrome d ubiquinol oxidase subunit I
MDPSLPLDPGAAPLLAARVQMAFTLGFHVVLACLGVGVPVLLLVAEGAYLRTGDEGWRTLARRWSKAFAVLFAVGAVSGTVLSFELGLLWPRFLGKFGAVIGLPFTLEAFAFFLEAIFLGIYLYGWDRLSPRAHWLCGFPIAVSGLASAAFVVTANAWMNAPRGFRLEGADLIEVDPVAAMLGPASGPQAVHMILAAFLVTGFSLGSVYAAARLRGARGTHTARGLTLGLAMGAAAVPVQAAAGHWAARVVAVTQPVKLAAMEGQFRTEARAPLRLGGFPLEEEERTRFALEIPGLLSWLAHGEMEAVVQGLDAAPRDDWPPVAVVHLAFQAMILAWAFLALLSLWSAVAWMRSRALPESRSFLRLLLAAGPLSVLALESGWIVTEVGRQPWIVQGVMRTTEAVTEAPGVALVLVASATVYGGIGTATVLALRRIARAPLPQEPRGT